MATIQSPPEQRVVLRNVDWDTYERLLQANSDSSAPRLAYDRGDLEIMSPLPEHEEANRNIAMIVEVFAEEFGIDIRGLGSTTFRRRALDRGFEADSCFYIQNESRVRGRARLDEADPPPDLVVEIEITSPAIPKLPIYASFGVPEVWRYNGERLAILLLDGDDYREAEESRALPGLLASDVERLLPESREQGRVAWLRKVRAWARELAEQGGATPGGDDLSR